MTVREAINAARRRLEADGVEAADFEARQLAGNAFGLSATGIALEGSSPAGTEELQKLAALLRRRLAGEPLQYILGEWEFYGLPFAVGEGVLIPRPDTELLVDCALQFLPEKASVLELCAGSGCIGVALARRRPNCRVLALEKSPVAFSYLETNIRRNGADNVTPFLGDLLHGSAALPEKRLFDCILSNPPYIPEKELPKLSREVRREPVMALDGGADGLDFYRAICEKWLNALKPGGCLLVEIGRGQAAEVKELFSSAGLINVEGHKDINGICRVINGTLPSVSY